jgi:hypothetical protein
MGTDELQSEIKRLIAKLKWSQKRLGREFYTAKYDDDDYVEIRRHEEKVKKDLSRPSTNPELLMSYLEVIYLHQEFKKLDIVLPYYRKSGVLSDEMEKEMMKISKSISNLVVE